MRLHWRVGASSNVGLVREHNEDSLYAGPRLLAVADGVGGAVAGEIASTIAISAMAPLDARPSIDDPLEALRGAVQIANDGVRAAITRDPALAGMGTTLTALLWSDDALGLAQLGDSRGYRVRGGELEQITRDQTLVQSLVDEGEITAEEALTHPRRSWILRALDGRADSEPELEILEPQPGDRYLLCSDGLSDYVAFSDLVDGLRFTEPQSACDRLVDLALQAGAPDNVTCIVADLLDDDHVPDLEPILLGAAADPPAPSTEPAAADDGTRIEPPSPAPAAGPRNRSLGKRLAAVASLVIVLIAAAVVGTAIYIHHQWYIATSAGHVAVYRGVTGSVAGHKLGELEDLTDLPVSALPQDDRDRVASKIKESSKNDANSVVANLRSEACALITPTPIPTSTPVSTPRPVTTQRPGRTAKHRTTTRRHTPAATTSTASARPAYCAAEPSAAP